MLRTPAPLKGALDLMNRYLVGVLHSICIGTFVFAAGLLWRGSPNQESVINLSAAIAVVTSGYINRKNYGSILTIFLEGPKGALSQFILGLGTIIGPVKLMASGFPIEGALPIFNALFLVLCIPFGGLSLFPFLIIGDWARGRLEPS